MSDFEVHPIGTATELRLSRALANAIAQMEIQYPRVVPHDVLRAYHALHEHYMKQMEIENQ